MCLVLFIWFCSETGTWLDWIDFKREHKWFSEACLLCYYWGVCSTASSEHTTEVQYEYLCTCATCATAVCLIELRSPVQVERVLRTPCAVQLVQNVLLRYSTRQACSSHCIWRETVTLSMQCQYSSTGCVKSARLNWGRQCKWKGFSEARDFWHLLPRPFSKGGKNISSTTLITRAKNSTKTIAVSSGDVNTPKSGQSDRADDCCDDRSSWSVRCWSWHCVIVDQTRWVDIVVLVLDQVLDL